MKSLLWELESRLDVIEKNQRTVLKLLESSAYSKKSSANSASSPRSIDSSNPHVAEKKPTAKKAKSIEIVVNVSSSDEETVKLPHQKIPPEAYNTYRSMKRYGSDYR